MIIIGKFQFVYPGIGLDPALPLITNSIRLSQNDAHMVHTIQTNAGYYGDLSSIGHVDICINNGNIQPFCTDSQSKCHFTELFLIGERIK